jgi:NADPH:quinone reductase-like Zn-dependent oxidoreductase
MSKPCSGIAIKVSATLQSTFNVGDRVCAFGAQPYANYPVVKGHGTVKVPDQMTFELAASIPIVYSTVMYALINLSQLQRGQKVFIRSATGVVGQAAIMLVQHLGADIFATVGSADKKRVLMSEFGVPADHIFSSRNTNFRQGITTQTNDYGVAVVLNSLAGEQFRESCDCLAYFGRFVETRKRAFLSNAKMDMGFILKNVTFSNMDLMLAGQFNPRLTETLM